MNAIEVKNLTKNFKDKIAVNNLTFNVKEGELFALLGTNGAGKTTLIKMLSCLIKPNGGDALLGGFSIVDKSYDVKKIINVSPQETSVAMNLSVKENLEFIARLYGFTKTDAVLKVQKIIKEFSLKEVENKKARILSGGYARRLSIAMALITEPKIIFLDEPTLGLDVIARRQLWSEIQNLKGKITVVLTTHYMEEAENLADRIGIMSNGKLKAVGNVQELIMAAKVEKFEDAFVKFATEEIK